MLCAVSASLQASSFNERMLNKTVRTPTLTRLAASSIPTVVLFYSEETQGQATELEQKLRPLEDKMFGWGVLTKFNCSAKGCSDTC